MASKILVSVFLVTFLAVWSSEAAVLTHGSSLSNSDSSTPIIEPADPIATVKNLNFCRHCVCGISRNTRIVNGEITSTHEFPWAVAVKYQGMHHCGANLITSKHLLTAAHCLHGFQQRDFTLHLADNATYRIKHITVHEDYNRRTDDNDIAIIELDRPARLGGAVRSICLPDTPTFTYNGKTGVTIGWGRLGWGEPVSKELRKVDVPIMSKEECQRTNYSPTRITDNMFCAGYSEGERDSCKGDSGGALQVRNEDGAMEVVGLVSFGHGCAEPNYPGVYTKVSNYLEWIGHHLDNECLCSSPSHVNQ